MNWTVTPSLEITADEWSLSFDKKNRVGKIKEFLKRKIGNRYSRAICLLKHEVRDCSWIIWAIGHSCTSGTSSIDVLEVVPLT